MKLRDDIMLTNRAHCLSLGLPDPHPNAAAALIVSRNTPRSTPNSDGECPNGAHGFGSSASAAAPDNQPVQRGSPLWNRLTMLPDYGICSECGKPNGKYDFQNGDYICDWCCAEIVAGQREDQRLDDPRHGQADRRRP